MKIALARFLSDATQVKIYRERVTVSDCPTDTGKTHCNSVHLIQVKTYGERVSVSDCPTVSGKITVKVSIWFRLRLTMRESQRQTIQLTLVKLTVKVPI